MEKIYDKIMSELTQTEVEALANIAQGLSVIYGCDIDLASAKRKIDYLYQLDEEKERSKIILADVLLSQKEQLKIAHETLKKDPRHMKKMERGIAHVQKIFNERKYEIEKISFHRDIRFLTKEEAKERGLDDTGGLIKEMTGIEFTVIVTDSKKPEIINA